MHHVLCTNTYLNVIDLVNHEIVKNTKTWISWERNTNFLQSKKKSSLVPHMTHFENLSSCSGGFLYHKLILFSENNYKNQAHIFYQNHLLVLYTLEIFCNFKFEKSLDLDLKNLGVPYWARINFIIYCTWTRKILEYLTGLGLILVYTEVRIAKYSDDLLDLDWFYDILDLDLKNTWTNWIQIDFIITK